MKQGQASQTAVLVCMARAISHGASSVARYSDPTAEVLLPEEQRARLQFLRTGQAKARNMLERLDLASMERRAKMMVVRTVDIDDAVREAAAPQVVILGAGLDGRAWRMPELSGATVFEVDHPDSQQDKRSRVGSLTQTAREVRFVPVDFTRDRLDDALQAAGHDPNQRTTWIWEGLVMYLSPAEVEATLVVVQRRSAPGSRLSVLYHRPAWILKLVGFLVARLGEPLRSSFTPEQMRALLGRYGFAIVRDGDIQDLSASMDVNLAVPMKVMKHIRIATADRRD